VACAKAGAGTKQPVRIVASKIAAFLAIPTALSDMETSSVFGLTGWCSAQSHTDAGGLPEGRWAERCLNGRELDHPHRSLAMSGKLVVMVMPLGSVEPVSAWTSKKWSTDSGSMHCP
jgi:hypothetical protein